MSLKSANGVQTRMLVGLVIVVALIASFPFEMLAAITIVYLLCIPFGWRAWNRLAREHGAREEEVTFEARPEGGADKP